MLLKIACYSIPFDSAQDMAETILKRIEIEGMRRPLHYKKINDDLLGLIEVAVDNWEKE